MLLELQSQWLFLSTLMVQQKLIITDGEISKKVEEIFDLRPYFIEKRLKLRNPIYTETAAYGHMGRKSEWVNKTFVSSSGEV